MHTILHLFGYVGFALSYKVTLYRAKILKDKNGLCLQNMAGMEYNMHENKNHCVFIALE